MHIYDEVSDFFVEISLLVLYFIDSQCVCLYESRATAISARLGPTLFALRTTNQELAGTRLRLSSTLRCISDFTEQSRGGLPSCTLIRQR